MPPGQPGGDEDEDEDDGSFVKRVFSGGLTFIVAFVVTFMLPSFLPKSVQVSTRLGWRSRCHDPTSMAAWVLTTRQSLALEAPFPGRTPGGGSAAPVPGLRSPR